LKTRSDDHLRLNNHRLADLRHKAAELERRLAEARDSLERELDSLSHHPDPGPAEDSEPDRSRGRYGEPLNGFGHEADADPDRYDEPTDDFDLAEDEPPSGRRTEDLVSRGRRSAKSRFPSRKRLVMIGAPALAALLVILIVALSGGGASWPTSVTTVQNEITRACLNSDVTSEPGQVNFACAKATRQVLWVFALLTSNDNPSFADGKTGRIGLEPITPAEGGDVAWSLNLHHPYDPTNPIDSLEVAARAINNIIGGATVTGTGGSSIIQPGLESSSANCVRYTGSSVLDSRRGFPPVCARPVTAPAGQAALVADIFQKWIVGASPRAAQDAALLFQNATNPGDPQVQAILRHLPGSQTPA
jgi:hypothetical protein